MERVRDWWSLVIFIGRVYRRALGTRKKKERGYEGVRELEKKNEETWNEREKEKKSVREKDRGKKRARHGERVNPVIFSPRFSRVDERQKNGPSLPRHV